MQKIYFTLLIALMSTLSMSFTEAQSKDPINQIVDEIAKHNVYEYGKLGYTGLRSKQYDRFLELCDKASNEELLTLTGHSNVIVRIYAFQGLKQRNVEIPAAIVKKFERDPTLVKIINGCEAFMSSVQKLTVGEAALPEKQNNKIIINGGPGMNR
jgi:hypothetical protein